MSDITLGELPQLRGHWLDRLPAMDRDITSLEERLTSENDGPSSRAKAAIQVVLRRPLRVELNARHEPPASFTRGLALTLYLLIQGPALSVRLYYRHVDQAESYQTADMVRNGSVYEATIPSTYTDSMFPLEYYFELKQSPEAVTLYPGFSPALTRQPYFVINSPLRSA